MSELLEFLRTHEEAFRSRARLASLYSDFRYQRHSNPDGYQANITAWQRALASAARAGLLPGPTNAAAQNSHFVLHSGDTLARALQTPDLGRPLSLGTVIEESLGKKELLPLKDFLSAKSSIYAKSWVPSIGQVVRWGLRQVGAGAVSADSSGGGERLLEGDFVVVDNIEIASQAVLNMAAKITTSNASRLFSQDLFISTFASALGEQRSISPTDLSILLTYLQRDRSAITYSATTGTVKFKAPGEAQPAPITDEDRSIASLRTLIASLEPQIQKLTDRVSSREAAAREAVSKKQLTTAKTALRQKQLADAALQQRTATLTQLEEVYAKIEQAADQVEVVRVMEAASHTLKTLNAQTGGVEKVQDVMDGLREQMMDTDEITQAINEDSTNSIDEGEVDDELQALEKEEQRKEEEAERQAREKSNEEEAEQTRQKLAQLDQMGEKKAAEETTTPPNEPLRAFEDNKNDESAKVAETAV